MKTFSYIRVAGNSDQHYSIIMMLNNFHFTILILMTMTLLSCRNQSDCAEFKNGKFFSISPVTKDKIIIERNDTLQVETNTETGIIMKSKISWKNPCEYQLTAMSNSKSLQDGVDSFFSITPIVVKIIDHGKDFYVFQAKIDSANKHVEYSDTIRILK